MNGETTGKGKGLVFVRVEVCKGCSYCIDFCPTHALEFSRQFNQKGYHYPVLAKPEACSGCDLCGLGFQREAVLRAHVKDISGSRRDLLVLSNDVSHIWAAMEAMVADTPGGAE